MKNVQSDAISQKQILHELEAIKEMVSCSKEVWTIKDVSLYTGLSLSCLYKHTMNGEIPHSKPNGKHIYFSRIEIEKWLLSNPIKEKSQIEKEAQKYVSLNPKLR